MLTCPTDHDSNSGVTFFLSRSPTSSSFGCGPGTRVVRTALSPPKDQPRKDTHPTRVRVEILDGHARANRQKPSGIASKKMILRVYLMPAFGQKTPRRDQERGRATLKAPLEIKSAKTVNNILAVLGILLKKAVDWDVIDRMPCGIKLLPIEKVGAAFHSTPGLRAPRGLVPGQSIRGRIRSCCWVVRPGCGAAR